jgi:hypothetical protein
MPKRIETNIEPINPRFFQLTKVIATSPTSTTNERLLASMLEEFGQTANILLAKLEYGQLTVTDDPPDKERNYARPPGY